MQNEVQNKRKIFKNMRKVIAFLLVVTIITTSIPLNVFASDLSNSLVTDDFIVDLGELNEEDSVESLQADSVISFETEILGEIVEKRTEYSKSFSYSDGTYKTMQYEIPVHYLDGDGVWVEYDNTLQLISEDSISSNTIGYETISRQNKIQISSDITSDDAISIENGDFILSWGYEDMETSELTIAQSAGTLSVEEELTVINELTQTVIYEDVYENVDLEYIILPKELKENYILNSADAPSEFILTYNIGTLTAQLQDDQNIVLKNGDDYVFGISAPLMYDSSGETSYELNLEIISLVDGVLTVNLSADEAWLNDEARVYPVVIDPTITTEQDVDSIDTTFIADGMSSTNFSAQQEMILGRESSYYGNCRVLMQFELPELDNGDMVVSADVNMCVVSTEAYTSTIDKVQFDVHTATSSWNNSTVTWNTKPSYDSDVLDYTLISNSSSSKWYSLSITEAVKSWYEGTDNNGVVIKLHSESGSNATVGLKATIWPERYNTADYAYPLITITYRNNKGLESYWDYTSIDVGSAGVASINNYSGNLVVTNTVASTTGNLLPVTIDMVYNGYMENTKYTNIYPTVGKGWKLSIQQTVRKSSDYGLTGDSAENFPYAYEDADGTVHFFYLTDDNQLLDEDGLGLELKMSNSSNLQCTITDSNDNVMSFNSYGNLVSISDTYDNKITIAYDTVGSKQIINSVTDGSGHKIVIEYNASSYYLNNITDSAGNKTTYYYTDGYMNDIKYSAIDGTVLHTYYVYNDSNKHLKYAISSDETALRFVYKENGDSDLNYQVTQVIEKAGSTTVSEMTTGQSIYFDRSNYNVTIVHSSGSDNIFNNSDDILNYHQFDDFGRTISIVAQKNDGTILGAAGGSYVQNGENINTSNRLSTSFDSSAYSYNYLKNSSAESTSNWTSGYWYDSDAVFSSANSSYYSAFGQKSLKLNVQDAPDFGGGSYYQTIDSGLIEEGEQITFSAYVKVPEDFVQDNSDSRFGATIALRFVLEDGSIVRQYATPISDSTLYTSETSDGWQQISMTEIVPENTVSIRAAVVILNAVGYAYFDGMQLEKSSGASIYNQIENSSFEQTDGTSPDDWTSANTGSTTISSTVNKMTGSRSLKFYGASDSDKKLYQRIELEDGATENDTYVLGGWAMANAVDATDSEARNFDMTAKIIYSDGTTNVIPTSAKFNTSVSDWQFASIAFNLSDENDSKTSTPVAIEVYLRYYDQANTAWFDDIFLVRDDYNAYIYDDEGNLIKASTDVDQYSSMTYDDNSNLTEVQVGEDKTYTYEYNDENSVVSATSPTGVSYDFSYFDCGQTQVSEISNSSGSMIIRTSQSVNAADDGISSGAYVTVTKDEDFNKTYYDYDLQSGLLQQKMVEVINEDGDVDTIDTTYDYLSGSGILSSVTTEDKTVVYDYNDTYSALTSITVNGFSYNFEYDDFYNLTKTLVGDQTLIQNYYQSGNGNLYKSVYGNGDYVEYNYNDLGYLESIEYNGKIVYSWSYEDGKIVSHIDNVNDLTYNYLYDISGRIIEQNVVSTSLSWGLKPSEFNVKYKYNTDGQIDVVYNTVNGYTVADKYYYTDTGLPEKFRISSDINVTYGYDSIGRLNAQTINTTNPIETTYIYWLSERNDDGENIYRTTKIKYETIGDTQYAYTYDDLGNILTIKEDGTLKVTYTYDEYSQLIREDNKYSNETIRYIYDDGGNLLYKKFYSYTTSEITNLSSNFDAYTYKYEDDNWADKLTSFEGQTITYDEIGNPLSYRDDMDFTWNGREMQTATIGNVDVEYTYDASGLRYSKTVDGVETIYQYSGDKLVYENRGGEYEFYYSYDGYGNLSCIRRFDSDGFSRTYLVTCNSRGDTEALYSSDGVLIGRYIYDAWGNVISIQDADGNEITSSGNIMTLNSIRYRGYYYDSETGFYYCQSRYYDSVTSRFINADSLVDNRDATSQNVFAYCGNNPVTRSDDGGHLFGLIAGAVISAVVGGVMGAINAKSAGKSVMAGAITGGLVGGVTGLIGGAVGGLIAAGKVVSGVAAVIGTSLANGAVAAAGNVLNQRLNYNYEKNANSTNKSGEIVTSSNGMKATDCDNFSEYVSYKEVAKSAIITAAFSPLSIGSSAITSSIFPKSGGTVIDKIGEVISNFALGGNVSTVQGVVELM